MADVTEVEGRRPPTAAMNENPDIQMPIMDITILFLRIQMKIKHPKQRSDSTTPAI
jgi:hypothetical protein